MSQWENDMGIRGEGREQLCQWSYWRDGQLLPWGCSVSDFRYNEVTWVSRNWKICIMNCVLCSNETLIAGVHCESSHMVVPTKRSELPLFSLQAGEKSLQLRLMWKDNKLNTGKWAIKTNKQTNKNTNKFYAFISPFWFVKIAKILHFTTFAG